MKKSKYSLKKVYESTLKNHKTDIVKEFKDSRARSVANNIVNAKTLKDLYYKPKPASDDDIINQTISTEIPGLGTFDLTPVQIGLIGCVDQYHYGDKQLALNLINVLKTGQSIESEEVNQRVGLASSVNEGDESKKEKDKKDKIKLDINQARKFLNYCKSEGILDEKYNINENKQIAIFDDYFISNSSGYLFELFLCFNIKQNFGANQINIYEVQERLSNHGQVIYISSILKIIYNLYDFNSLEIAWNDLDHFKLYQKLIDPKLDIFEGFISSDTKRKDLFFEFIGGKAAIDIYVRKKDKRGEIITALDLKTSAVGKEHKRISSSTTHLDSQIASITKQNQKNEKINDFVIGLLNVKYKFDKERIEIKSNSDITCKYFLFSTDYDKYYEKCIKSKSQKFKFREDDTYFTLEEEKFKPINSNIKNISAKEIKELYIERANNQNVDDLKTRIDDSNCNKYKIDYIKHKYSYFEPEEFDELINLLTTKHPDVLDKKKFNLIKDAFAIQKSNKEFKRLPKYIQLFELIKNTLDDERKYHNILKNNTGSFNNRSTALGNYFHDNPREISKVCDLVYDYTNAAFNNNLAKGPYYKYFLEYFYDHVKKLNKSIEKKEINPTDEKAKDVLSKINFYNWREGINYASLESDAGLKEYSINMFNEKVLKILEQNISRKKNRVFRIPIMTGENIYEKKDDTTTNVTDIEILIGNYFRQNPRDLVNAYNELFDKIKTEYNKNNNNFSFYSRILDETYKSVLNQLKKSNQSSEELTEEKLEISDIEVERLKDQARKDIPKNVAMLKNKLLQVFKKLLKSPCDLRSFKKGKIDGNVGSRPKRNDDQSESNKNLKNSKLGDFFLDHPESLLEVYTEVVNEVYKTLNNKKSNKDEKNACKKFLRIFYTEVYNVIEKSSNDDLKSELEKNILTLRVKDTMREEKIDKITDSIYIPGSVISERLSKKKTLKEVYKNLF